MATFWTELTAPCFRCRAKDRVIKNPEVRITANNKTMIYGTCEQCNTKLARLVKTGTTIGWLNGTQGAFNDRT